MKAAKFLLKESPQPPPMSRDELATFRWWMNWAKRREERRDKESFERTNRYFKDATHTSICDYVDSLLEKEKEAVRDAFSRTSYSGKVEEGHFEKFLKWRDYCKETKK